MLTPLFITDITKEILEGYVEGNILASGEWMPKGEISKDCCFYTIPLERLYAEILRDCMKMTLFNNFEMLLVGGKDLGDKYSALSKVMEWFDVDRGGYLEDVGFVEDAVVPEELKDVAPVYKIQSHWGNEILFRMVNASLLARRDEFKHVIRVVGDKIYIIECLPEEVCGEWKTITI